VKEYCADNHAGEVIKTIYKEVYNFCEEMLWAYWVWT
jgi:hypothetical protein